MLTGDGVADARVRPSVDIEGPYVELILSDRGADIFEEVTGANVGRRLAIILDNTVYSAPVIRDRIGGGRASITGGFDISEARDLAIVLRAGALPAPVTIAEERTVGPSLGRDSIEQGTWSFIVGGAVVLLFMVIYYNLAGMLADVALGLNILLLLAALAMFDATLTLPGIAGIVLTVGMAVDANVLINERMREEVRLGKGARAAVESGYERALPAIFDSNITDLSVGPDPVPVRLGSHQGVCRHAVHRHRQHGVHHRVLHARGVRLLSDPPAADPPEPVKRGSPARRRGKRTCN